MRRTLISIFLFFVVVFSSTAQNNSLIKQKELELKEKLSLIKKAKDTGIIEINDHQVYTTPDKNPVVLSGSKEYNLLKAEGKLAHYQIKHKEGKIISLEKKIFPISPTSSSLTPCDPVIPATTPPFSSPTDDGTYYDTYGTYISLPFNFCFYGTNYTQVNYSTNGNIQFPPTNSGAFSSTGFPVSPDQMIAPFWADLDNRGVGDYFIDVFPTYAVFTWTNCGYYNSKTDKTNSFQLVITDGLDPILPPGKNVGFYYGTMEWTTGDFNGINGFPNPSSPVPATVGANAGNGIDYFLIGRFGQPGSSYDGPLGANDGISWLTGKNFYFNLCPAIGANNEPIPTLLGYCDTLKVCGNDTLYIKNTFIAPEVSQSVTVTATAPTLGSSFSYSVLPNTNSTDIFMIVNGSTATSGYHAVTMTATDNGTPPLSSNQTFQVYVNQSATNNLNGNIVLTPTLGACPGGIVSASVNIGGGVPDSYLWNNNSTGSTTTFTTVMSSDSIVFVTITSGQCKKTLTDRIRISPTPVANIIGNLSICTGLSPNTILTATNTLNSASQAPYSYTWTGTGSLTSATTNTTVVTGGVYTVTITNQYGCTSTATQTVTLNESPSYSITTNAITNGSVFCTSQDTARLAFHYLASFSAPCSLGNTNCITSNIVQTGTNTTTGSATAYTPYAGLWESAHHQYVYRASELIAAGLQAGKLSSLAFNITNINGGNNSYANFKIGIACTSNSVLTTAAFDYTNLVQVYTAPSTPITAGWNTYSFSQPYIWDGVSNILVDVCHYDINWTGNNTVEYTNVGYNATKYDFTFADICGGSFVTGTSQNRPNMRFANCLAQQSSSQFNVTVTPTLGVVIPATKDSIKINLPNTSSTTCYTISVVNPIGGCLKDTIICIQADQGITNANFVANTNPLCLGSPVVLSASGANTYTISHIQGGSSVQLTTNSSYTDVPTQVGLNVYSLTAIGFCGASPVGYTVGVMVVPIANLAITPLSDVTKCMNTPFIVNTSVSSTTPGNSGTPYNYAWTTLPSNIPAPGVNNNSSYSANSNSTSTLVVKVNGSCTNTISDTMVVKNFPDNLVISIPDTLVICGNRPFTINSQVSGGHPIYNYAWYLAPNNQTVISNNSGLTYTSPENEGYYTINVSVVDSCGYNKTDTEIIRVLPPCNVVIPNVITANGDGTNDVFKIKNIDLNPNTNVTVFDRWGKKVYENPNYNNEWKAENVSDGTYFYIIDVPNDKKYSGFITVFHSK